VVLGNAPQICGPIPVHCAGIPLWCVLKSCVVDVQLEWGLLCSGLNASILLAVVYGVVVDKVTYWAYGTAHFIGRAEETRGVCLIHSSPAMCVTLRQWHAELDWPGEYHGSMSPKAGHWDTQFGTNRQTHTHIHKYLSVHRETNSPTFVFQSLSVFCSLFNLSQSGFISGPSQCMREVITGTVGNVCQMFFTPHTQSFMCSCIDLLIVMHQI